MESDRDLDHERTELREDEKKLQKALQEYDEAWDYASEEEDDEEDRFVIDLEYEGSEAARQSAHSAASSVGSTSHSVRQSAIAEDDESSETRDVIRNLPSSSSLDDHGLASSTTGVADPEKTLALNRALQGILEGHIESINEALDHNRERQERLEEEVTNPTKTGKCKGGPFRAPYFRADSEYPEPNEDVLAKSQMGHARLAGPLGTGKDLRYFPSRAKNTLKKCVMEDCLEQMIRPLMSKMEAEIERCDQAKSSVEEQECQLELERPKLETTTDPKARMDLKFLIAELEEGIKEQRVKVKEHAKKVSKLEEEIKSLKKNKDEKELLNSVDSEKVDWMRISKMNYGGNKSYIDCQKAWDHFVCPKVKTGPWTPDEKARLKELTVNANSASDPQVDWAQVAQDLGTGRTAFQCMSCYQRNFNMDLRSRPWTEEEEKRLIEEANKIKDCVGYYNWRKVSAFVDNRSPYECMLRFTQVDPNHRHGKFTPEEDAKLLAGVEMFGLRWKAIARFIGTRNSVQVRDRYLECLNPENNYLAFTYDEDLKLLKQHKKFGPCWAQICQFFQGRSASRLGSRFRQLQRWKKKKAWFESQPVEVKRMLLGKALPLNERREMETKIRDYFTEQLGINLNDYKRQILDRNNGVDPDVIPPRPPFVLKANGALEKEWSTRWALKISSHERLRKSLQRILTEDAKRRAKAKSVGKLPRVVEEENEEELYKQAVTEALKEQSAVASTKPQKNKLKKMEGLLAKAFHEGSAIHVSKILEALNDPKEAGNSRGKLRKKHRSIDMALKNFFQADNKEKYRPGRIRKFFEKDMRSDEIVQAEKAELEVLVPAMCLKSLGTSLPQLYGSARRHHVLLQEQLLNFPSHSDDPEFLAQNARLDQQLEECALEETSGGQKDDVAREKLIKKKRRLDTIFINRYLMEQKKLKTATFSLQEDIALFHRLLGETGEVAGLAQGLPAVWLPKTKAVAAGDQESKVKEMHSSPVDISAPSVSPAKLAELGLESAAVSSETILKLTLGELSDLKSETSDLKRPASEVEPQAEIKEEGIECADSNQLILLSESQIEEEKQRLEPTNYYVPPSEECALTLPCIPPNVTTLTLLKSLLLKRGELMRQSALLTKIGNVLSKSDSEPIVESSERKLTDDNNEAGEKIVIVDSEGQEINMEEFAEFIEEETQPVDDRKKVLSKEGNRLNKGKGSSPFVNQNKNADFVLKHMKQSDAHVKSRDKIRTIDLISSNPEYNVANFSLKESIKRSEDSETNWKLWEKGKGQGKTGTEYQRQKFKSNYEVVVVPTSNRAPPPVQKKAKKEFLPPKSFARVGKTYSCVQKSDRGGSIDSSQGNGNTKIDLCQAQLKDNASQSASNSSQPLSSNTALGSSSDGFEFPYLVNTGKEVIEIDQDDSEPEPEGEDTNLSDSYTERVSGAFEERAAASDGKYQNLLSGVQIPKRRFSDKNVVVVDIAPESGNIVHYKQDSKGGGTFRACELKPSINAEGGTNICISGGDEIVELGNDDTSIERTVTIDVRETLGSMEILRKEKQLVKKFKAIDFVKESPAYKTLEARMRALFLWPVLMSTVRHIQNPRLMEGVQRDVSFDPPNPRYKKRGRPTLLRNKRKKMTKAMTNEKHKKSERYRRSQFMQQKRQEWREARDGDTATQAPIEDKCAGDARVGTVSTGASEMPPSEAVSLEDVTLAFPDRNDGCGVGDKAAVQENGAHSSGQAGSGTAQEQPKKRGRGRQKGCRYKKKIYPPAIERPKRNTSKRRQPEEEVSPRPRKARKAKETSPPLKTPMDLREHTRAIPQWWKDAMLAAMMAKQTLAREGEGEGPEVRVEDDEDFIDRGNYSDDEWVQDWRRDQSRGTEEESEANNVDGQENK